MRDAYIYRKTFTVLLKTVKTVKVQPSESFPVYGIVFVVVFTLVGRLKPGNNLLVCLYMAVNCCQLLRTIITAYPISSTENAQR